MSTPALSRTTALLRTTTPSRTTTPEEAVSHPHPSRARRLVAAAITAVTVIGALGVVAVVAPAAPAGAAQGVGTGASGQTLTVSDVDDLPRGGATVTVTGAGFDIAGFDLATEGMYLALCVDSGPSVAPSPCVGGVDMTGETSASRWITNNPIGGAPNVAIAADGSFTTTLKVQAADENVDCLALASGQVCKVVTRMDHRTGGDRSQDVKVPVTFSTNRTAIESFVTAAHVDFLGEAPTPAELSTDAAALVGGRSRSAYLRTMTTSDAWLAAIVNGLYQDTLGRNGSAADVAFWSGRLRSGWSVARVAASFYAAPEYFNGIGGGSNTTWVADLYEKILLRSADSGGLTYWTGQVVAKGRGNVALRMYQSPESAGTRVKGLYQDLLGRAPSSGDLTYWRPVVISKGDLSLAVSLAAAPEYGTRAALRFP